MGGYTERVFNRDLLKEAQVTLQHLVREAFGQETSVALREEMEKGASSRRYYRLTLNGASPAVPGRIVQMALPDDAMKSDEASASERFDELPFVNVQRHLKNAGLPVPEIFLDATARGHVLLEDLGELTFNANLRGKGPDEVGAWYEAAVDLLSTMHDTMWPVAGNCYAGRRFFDYALLRWELDHFREWGVEARLDCVLPPRIRETLDGVFDAFAAEIDQLPKGFVHRDYQSRNLMVKHHAPSPDSLAIIDFQDALTGPRTYDLVALLNDSYVDLNAEVQQRLIERYARNRRLPADEIQREFDLITVQRKLKDGGRFIFIDRVKGDSSFLPFVDKSFSRVKSALLRIDGHRDLKEILARVAPESFGQ